MFLGEAAAVEPGTSAVGVQGDWVGEVGSDGYVLAGFDGGVDRVVMPLADVDVSGTSYVFAGSTTDVRALVSPDSSGRSAAAWYSGSAVVVTLTFTESYSGPVSVYAVDWNNGGRGQTVEIAASSGSVSSSMSGFAGGEWVENDVTVAAGDVVTVTATRTAGYNSVVSGVFLGEAAAVEPSPDEPPPADGTICSYRPLDFGMSVSIEPGYETGAVETQVLQRRVNGGAWLDRETVSAASTGALDSSLVGNETSVEYRIDARSAAGVSLISTDCDLHSFSDDFVWPNIDVDGNVGPLQLDQQELVDLSESGVCDIPAGHQLFNPESGFEFGIPGTSRKRLDLAFFLPEAPDGYRYQMSIGWEISREADWTNGPAGELAYAIYLHDAVAKRQQGTGHNYLDGDLGGDHELSRSGEMFGTETSSGYWFADGGYVRVNIENFFGGFGGGRQNWKIGGSEGFALRLIPEGVSVAAADLANYPEVGLPANPCLLTYSPDEPGLLPPSFKDVPGQGPIDWAVVGETTYEVILFGGSFIPGFDCLDAIVNGFAIANSSFCLADIFSGGLASSIPDAYKLATRPDEVVALVRGRNGDEVLRLRTRATKTISCALNSFPTGTQVRMADGTLRPIETIEPGDSVLTANPETGEWSNQRVLDQWSHLDDGDMTTATFDDGSEITATDHHLFWVDNQGAWVRLEDVQSGDSLLTPEGVTTVDHVVTAGATSTLVWELDTQTTDTFTVNTGTADVVVHNADEVARNWVMVDSNWLKDLGIDAHQLKDDVGRDAQFDIFRDKNTGALGVGRKGLPPGSEVELLNMRVVNGVVEYVRC